ncbi:MAG: hypothetical protein HQK96_04130 [Nitrospirae bacterium]|nr:hypothetical protein [Nitrospirota bacterium]
MKADFNNPVIFVTYNGKSLVEKFKGPSPNGWLTSCNIITKYNGYATFDVVLSLPYSDALDLLADFVGRRNQINLGSDWMSVQLGYYPNYFSPVYYGFVTDFPSISFGATSTITFKGTGGEKKLFTNNQAKEYKGTLFSIIVQAMQDGGVVVGENQQGTLASIKDQISKMDSTNGVNSTVFITRVAGILLNSITPNNGTLTKNENSWSFIRSNVESVGLKVYIAGSVMVIFDITESASDTPVATFVLFGSFNSQARTFPVEEINIDYLPTTWMGAGTQVQFVPFEPTKGGSGQASQNSPSDGAAPGTSVLTTSEAGQIGEDVTKKVVVDGSQSNSQANAKSSGETAGNQIISCSCKVDTIGIPDIFPGDLVRTELGRSELAWNWGVIEASHDWDGTYKSKFTLIVGGNVLLPTNEKEAPKSGAVTVDPTPLQSAR